MRVNRFRNNLFTHSLQFAAIMHVLRLLPQVAGCKTCNEGGGVACPYFYCRFDGGLMKRFFNFILIFVLLGGFVWWQRATVVPWVVKTIPGSEAAIVKVPFLADALHPANADQQAANDGGAGRSRRSNAPVPVVLATADTRQLPTVIDAVGTATPYASIQIRTRIDNTAVTSVRVAEGAEVKQDDILFTLDDRTIKAQISQIEAQIAKDQAQIAQSQIDLGRANDLLNRNAGAAMTRDTAATAVKMAQAQLQSDQAALDSAKATLDYTVIRAPVPGRIGSIPVRPGSTVRTSDSAPLATLNQLDPAVAAFSIPQDRLGELREAMARGPVQGRRHHRQTHAHGRGDLHREQCRSFHRDRADQGRYPKPGGTPVGRRVRQCAGDLPRNGAPGRDPQCGRADRPEGELCLRGERW